ncbi:MAG: VUT family protein, partial [Clostridia bacterium]|nr:VUT family protein [Clostridia bacterium]
MKERMISAWEDTKLLFRSVPSAVTALFAVSVIAMNLLANKTIYQSDILALDGGILISWLSFLCMDIVTKAFGPKAATKLSVFATAVNLFVCLLFYIVSIIPTETDYTAFNTIIGGTWF